VAQPAERPLLSEQDYLAFERAADERHEYANGEIFAMSGGTWEHSLIGVNLAGELRAALLDRPCSVHGADMRIHIPANARYTYADVLVVCGEPVFLDEARDTVENAVVIVEVLSDSSERYDRGDKFEQYRSIPSLRHYVLASQKRPRLEHFERRPDGAWLLRVAGPGEEVTLAAIDAAIAVDRAYLKVFP
jgi:Uma2 family endonuclease